ncbi:hypothetical protein PSHT_15527 [Puccinia striiformis]|uniref:Integrase catalytic domain-containing protein n=1 Tax=Puccinia striiformis TaxID=27350 RepID=A0A2S4UER2_9BASI|nr:hypothetical protein PSHT_15527 [Puccinia striiformis]
MPEFGTVTSFQAAALFLDSLDNNTNLTPIIQTCYDISPFDLKNVTYRVSKAMRRTNRVEHQNGVMMASNSNSFPKSNKKKNKQSDAPKPKVVAPTINNLVSKSGSSNPPPQNCSTIFSRLLLRFLVFDTGATQSCVINLKLLTDVQPLTNHYMNMFLSPIEATHVGTLKIGTYFINPVYHVPNGCANILLASQLIDHGLKPHFKMDQFLLKGGDKIVATFPHIGRLFLAPISDYICVVNRKIPENFDWHYALGHALDKYVYLFCRQNNASSALSTKAINCEICTKAKIHQTAHSQKSPSSTTSFHRLHTDVLQITLISKFGYRCILVIVDDASCFNRIYLLKSKSESESRLLSFFEEIKNKLQQMPAYLHSNCGGEFSSLNFLDKLKEYRISIEQGPADSPQTNGVAERFNGVILKKIKCMLLQSKIPQSMWHEAACHASAILNILPHLLLNWHSPTSVLVKQNSSIKPDCTGMPLIPWFYDCLVHQVIVSRDYVVPNIEVDAGSSVADAEKILKAFNMETSNAVKTPLPTNVLHQVDLESEPFDASIMQKAMGYINYLAIHT